MPDQDTPFQTTMRSDPPVDIFANDPIPPSQKAVEAPPPPAAPNASAVERLTEKEKKTDDPPKKEKEVTEAELDAFANDALDSLGFKPKEQKGEKQELKGEKTPKTGTDGEKPGTKSEKTDESGNEPPPERKTTVTRRPAPVPVDAAALAREVAVETGKAVAQELAKSQAKAEPQFPELNDVDKHDVAVLEHMEKGDTRYKGVAKKVEKFFREVLSPYRAEWEAKNPDKEYDSTDVEHEAVYDKQPDFDKKAFDAAGKSFDESERERRIEERVDARLRDNERKNAARYLEPTIQQKATAEVVNLIKTVEPEYEKLLKEEKPWEKMNDDDPVASEILNKSARFVSAAATEFEKMMSPELGYNLDTNNPMHADIVNYAIAYEQRLKGLPPEKRMFEGKEFATLPEWKVMTDAQKARHWKLELSDIRADYFSDFAVQVKGAVERERSKAMKTAQKLGYTRAESASETPPKEKVEVKETPATKPKPKPPSTSSSTDNLTGTEKPSGSSKTFADEIVADLFGG